MFCTKCGTRNNRDALFCRECGCPLEADQVGSNNTAKQNNQVEQSIDNTMYFSSLQGKEQTFLRESQLSTTTEKHKGKRRLVIILVVGLIVSAVTVGVFVYKGIRPLVNINSGAKAADKRTVEVTFRPTDGYIATKAELDLLESVIKKRLDNIKITNRDVNVDYDQNKITLRFEPSDKITDASTAQAELGSIPMLTFEDSQGKILLEGKDVKSARAVLNSNNVYETQLQMTPEGTQKLDDATRKNMGNTIDIKLDTLTILSATVQMIISDGSIAITGNDNTAASSKSLADQINAGTLTFGLEVVSFQTNISQR